MLLNYSVLGEEQKAIYFKHSTNAFMKIKKNEVHSLFYYNFLYLIIYFQ